MDLSIRNVPDDLVQRLRERARRNGRSIQAEILAILEGAVPAKISVREAMVRVRALGIESPSESTRIIRRMRDSR
ncbi:MAG: Arc family DNA-binding protein [Acidobacteria bacterium]|nr:Arc family DNA-binding protein [Acidobacteriota bacterium]